MNARRLENRDLQHLRMLAGQMARDAKALQDAIPEADDPAAYANAATQITPAIADLGEGINQWYLFWEDATLQGRLES